MANEITRGDLGLKCAEEKKAASYKKITIAVAVGAVALAALAGVAIWQSGVHVQGKGLAFDSNKLFALGVVGAAGVASLIAIAIIAGHRMKSNQKAAHMKAAEAPSHAATVDYLRTADDAEKQRIYEKMNLEQKREYRELWADEQKSQLQQEEFDAATHDERLADLTKWTVEQKSQIFEGSSPQEALEHLEHWTVEQKSRIFMKVSHEERMPNLQHWTEGEQKLTKATEKDRTIRKMMQLPILI